MSAWIDRIKTGWHPMRLMRAGIATMLLVTAFNYADWPMGIFGLFFLFQAVTDTGCGLQGCSTPGKYRKADSNTAVEVEYEEIK